MTPNAIHLSELKVGVIINTSSGGYDLECEDKMLDILNGGVLSRRRFGVPTQMNWSGRLQRRPARSSRCLSPLVETAPSGERQKHVRHRAYLIPLAGGTMNMLARALYGDTSWQ